MPSLVLTIGHSNRSWGDFLHLLAEHKVEVVCDVRSVPRSRLFPHFDRESLHRRLRAAGLRYVFLGRELGARPKDPSCYVGGQVQYSLLARTDAFRQGLDRVRRGSRLYRIVLMCAERDPLLCHRAILLGPSLTSFDLIMAHVLDRGVLEPHAQFEDRLLQATGNHAHDLFSGRETLLAEAYERQAARIAFRPDRESQYLPEDAF